MLCALRLPDRVGGVFVGGGEPAGQGHLLLGVEGDAFGALDVQIAEEGFVPAGEGEPGHRGGDADVDADHAGVEVALELAGGVAGAGENAGAVAVFAVAADGEGFVEVFGAHDGEDRAENFFLGQPHAGFHLVDHAGAEQEAVGGEIALAAIERDVGAFLGGDVEIGSDLVAMLLRR